MPTTMDPRAQLRNWHAIGDRHLERHVRKVSNEQWKAHPGDVCAVAPLGSLVAVLSSRVDTNKSYPPNVKGLLRIFNGASCFMLTSLPWSVRLESLISLQWSDYLLLGAIFHNACVRVFSAHGDLMHHFYLFFKEDNPKGTNMDPSIVTLYSWGGGVIYSSKETKRIYIQKGFEEVDCTYVDIGEYCDTICALGVIPNENWHNCVVIIVTTEGAFYMSMNDLLKCREEIYFMKALTPLRIGNEELMNKFVSCQHPAPGSSSVCFALCNIEKGHVVSMKYKNSTIETVWEGQFQGIVNVHVVGNGILALEEVERIRFCMDSEKTLDIDVKPICISSEIGRGIRLFTSNTVEYYKLVSKCMERVLIPGSSEPAAVLLKTYDLFNKGDVKACETLRNIRGDITAAVDTCLKAAESSWDFDIATLLLNTVLLGRSIYSVYRDPEGNTLTEDTVMGAINDAMKSSEAREIQGTNIHQVSFDDSERTCPADTSDVCHHSINVGDRYCGAISMLRIVNSLRMHQCEIVTNISQLLSLGPEALVMILAAIKCHLFAIRIAAFLGIDKKGIILHWVRTRVKLGGYMTDGDLVEAISKTLRNYAGIVVPYSDLAVVIAKEKRETLALAILDKEGSLVKKFRVMCQWNELKKAASIAADSCNPLFAAYVILLAQRDNKLDMIIDVACSNLFIRDVFIKQCKLRKDFKVLQVFYERTNDIMNAGVNAAKQTTELMKNAGTNELHTKSSMQQLISHFSSKQNDSAEDVINWLKFSSDFFGTIVDSKGSHRPDVVETAMSWREAISRQQELIKAQAELERNPEIEKIKVVGRSLIDTLYVLYKHDMTAQADALAARFRVPFNQHWRSRIAGLYDVHNINELVKMSSSKAAHAEQNASKTGKGPIDMVIDALISLGATSSVENVIATMKPQHRQHWNDKLNRRSSTTNQYEEGTASIFAKLSKRFWH